MSPLKLTTFAAIALAVAAPALAAESQPNTEAACKQARMDLQFMQQLAASDGNTNPYLNAPLPAECKTNDSLARAEAAKKYRVDEKTVAGTSAAAHRYN